MGRRHRGGLACIWIYRLKQLSGNWTGNRAREERQSKDAPHAVLAEKLYLNPFARTILRSNDLESVTFEIAPFARPQAK
jgi:hypothetical protein